MKWALPPFSRTISPPVTETVGSPAIASLIWVLTFALAKPNAKALPAPCSATALVIARLTLLALKLCN